MQKLDESLLIELPPFSSVASQDIRAILDLAFSKRVDEGHAIFDEGTSATHFYLLLDGCVRVVHITPEGEQVTVLHIPAGQLFGFAAALGKKNYPATAIAAAECIVLSWPMQLWDDFNKKYEGFSAETGKTIGKRLGEMNGRIVEMATLHVEQRVARALLRLIEQSGRKTDTGIEIDFPITRQDISEMTGTTLHTVSRLLSAWQRDGIVESGRKRITVREPHQLVRLSETPLS